MQKHNSKTREAPRVHEGPVTVPSPKTLARASGSCIGRSRIVDETSKESKIARAFVTLLTASTVPVKADELCVLLVQDLLHQGHARSVQD